MFNAKDKLDYGIADKETGRKDCKQALLSFVLDEKEWVIACELFRDGVAVYSPAQEQTKPLRASMSPSGSHENKRVPFTYFRDTNESNSLFLFIH